MPPWPNRADRPVPMIVVPPGQLERAAIRLNQRAWRLARSVAIETPDRLDALLGVRADVGTQVSRMTLGMTDALAAVPMLMFHLRDLEAARSSLLNASILSAQDCIDARRMMADQTLDNPLMGEFYGYSRSYWFWAASLAGMDKVVASVYAQIPRDMAERLIELSPDQLEALAASPGIRYVPRSQRIVSMMAAAITSEASPQALQAYGIAFMTTKGVLEKAS